VLAWDINSRFKHCWPVRHFVSLKMQVELQGGPRDGETLEVPPIPVADGDLPTLLIGSVFAIVRGMPCLIHRGSRYELTDGRWQYRPGIAYDKMRQQLTAKMDA
jgi:hypothetical protein